MARRGFPPFESHAGGLLGSITSRRAERKSLVRISRRWVTVPRVPGDGRLANQYPNFNSNQVNFDPAGAEMPEEVTARRRVGSRGETA
jgi:hypothetical protein